MRKRQFKVALSRPGREDDFRDFWDHGKKMNAKGEALHSDFVGLVRYIDATSLEAAISIAFGGQPWLQSCFRILKIVSIGRPKLPTVKVARQRDHPSPMHSK